MARMNQDHPAGSVGAQRMQQLFDPGSFAELDAAVAAQGKPAGVLCGFGRVEGVPVFAFCMDPALGDGGFGAQEAAKLQKVYALAEKTGAPLVGIYDAKGGRLPEGAQLLEAASGMLAAANRLSGVSPQIAVVTGRCIGAAALTAAAADFVILSQDAEYFLGFPQQAGEGLGNARAALSAGAADAVADSPDSALAMARRLIAYLPQNNLAAPPVLDFSAPEADPAGLAGRALAEAVFDDGSLLAFREGVGRQVFAGLATLAGAPCGVLACEGGPLCKNCTAKMARLMRICDAFHLPVVTLLDAPGFAMADVAAASLMVREAARLAQSYADATCPKVTLITGCAYGPAYIALAGKNAGADLVLAWPEAEISPLTPAATTAILLGDQITAEKSRGQVELEYAAGAAAPFAAASLGFVDEIVAPADTRAALITALEMLEGKRVQKAPKKHANLL